MRPLDPTAPGRILVRAVNWVGDAVMTLPALQALAAACPQAELVVLAKPWVSAVYRAAPVPLQVREFHRPGPHAGLAGLRRLGRELRGEGFHWAILLQNAFQAALIAWLARVPVRAGYACDGRRLLLTHAVARRGRVRRVHQSSYYLHLLHGLGLVERRPPAGGVPARLEPLPRDAAWAEEFLSGQGLAEVPLLGLAPGAAYGPAKCWPGDRFAAAARELVQSRGLAAVLLFGSAGERPACARVRQGLRGVPVLDLSGATTLGRAMALLARLELLVSNDSGLMHLAAALGVPTLAVFGSTDPGATAPLGPRVAVVQGGAECAPCLKPVCPRPEMTCFDSITPERVAARARELLSGEAGP